MLGVLAAGVGGVPIETEKTSESGSGEGSILQGKLSRPGGVLMSKVSRQDTGAVMTGSGCGSSTIEGGPALCCDASLLAAIASSSAAMGPDVSRN